jgi:phage terminase small subunit
VPFVWKDVIALLNVKQEAFCLHYATSGNATESYKQAGYACKNDNAAGASARRLLQQDKIKARLNELAEEMASEKIANGREIQERLTAILRGELKEDQVVVEGCGDGVSEASIIHRNPQLKDVIRAAVELARMQGAYDSKVQVELTIPVFGGEEEFEAEEDEC